MKRMQSSQKIERQTFLKQLLLLITSLSQIAFGDQTILVGCDGEIIGPKINTYATNITFQSACEMGLAPLLQSLISQVPGTSYSLFTNFTINAANHLGTLTFSHLNSLKFQNTDVGSCPKNGSLMRFENVSEVELRDISIKDCVVDESLIIVDHAKAFLIDNCTFQNISCTYCNGASLSISSSNVEINSSKFILNLAQNDVQNKEKEGGQGGVAQIKDNSIVNIELCTLADSQAVKEGGALQSSENSTVGLHSCNVTNNSVLDGNGGALFAVNSSKININSSTLIGNWVDLLNGGVISAELYSTINIYSCIFQNNTAGFCGGVVSLFSFSKLNVDSSIFTDNIAYDRNGGALQAQESSTATITSSNFSQNMAINGGVIYLQDSNATIDSSNQNGNSTSQKGGSINGWKCTIEIHSSTFLDDLADEGGSIFVLQAENLQIKDSNFSQGNAKKFGGALSAQASVVLVNSSNFSSNSAMCGGGIYTTSGSLWQQNSVFRNNQIISPTNDLLIDRNHPAQDFVGGGAIAVQQGDLNIINSMFTENRADGAFGGAVWVFDRGEVDELRLFNSSFDKNIAKLGGAVWVVSNVTRISDCNFSANSATQGGAIWSQYNALDLIRNGSQHNTLDLVRSRFSNCSAQEGGAIKVMQLSGDILRDNQTLTQFLTAKQNNTFEGNIAYSQGNNAATIPSKIELTKFSFRNGSQGGKLDPSEYTSKNKTPLSIMSGQEIEVTFQLFDEDNNAITKSNDASIIVYSDQNAKLSGDPKIRPSNTNSSKFLLTSTPHSSSNVYFSGPQIDEVYQLPKIENNNKPIMITINQTGCKRGQVQSRQPGGMIICIPCTENRQSLVEDPDINASCLLCEYTGVQQCTVDEVILQPKQWRDVKSKNIEIYECPDYSRNCRGGFEKFCNEGQIGALCMACDMEGNRGNIDYKTNKSGVQTKQGRFSRQDCQECNRGAYLRQGAYGLSTIIFLGLYLVYLKNTIKCSHNALQGIQLRRMGMLPIINSSINSNFGQFKIFMSQLGTLSPLISVSVLKQQQGIKAMDVVEATSQIGDPLDNIITQVDCILIAIGNGIKLPLLKLLFVLALITALSLTYFAIIYLSNRKPMKKVYEDVSSHQYSTDNAMIYSTPTNRLVINYTGGLVINSANAQNDDEQLSQPLSPSSANSQNNSHQNMIKLQLICCAIYLYTILQLRLIIILGDLVFSRNISKQAQLRGYMQQKQDDPSIEFIIVKLVAIPSLIALTLVIPLQLLFKLRRNRHRLTSVDVVMSYGLLFREQKDSINYWDCVKFMQKNIFVIIISYFEIYTNLRDAQIVLLMATYLILLVVKKPYSHNHLLQLELASTVISILNVGLLNANRADSSEQNQEWARLIATTIFVVINIVFSTQMIILILRRLIFTQTVLHKIRTKLITKLPGLINWLSNKSQVFDVWIHEEDHHLRRFTNIKNLRRVVMEHIHTRKCGLREVEQIGEVQKGREFKQLIKSLEVDRKIKGGQKSSNDEVVSNRFSGEEMRLTDS